MEPWVSDQWWVSKYNFAEDFRSSLNLPQHVKIHDATLRDGEQTAGVVFSAEDKVNIAKLLDELGVDRIEAGMPAVSEQDAIAIKRISKLNLKAKIVAFCRTLQSDVDLAKECGVDGVVVEIPTGYPKLKYQFAKWTEDDIINKSVDIVKYAHEQGLEVIYFGYDTTRANWDFLKRLYTRVIHEGRPDSIGIVDTTGCILPNALKFLIKKVKSEFDIKVEIHTHNDMGMATAISMAAVEAGAEVVHTSINGLGERSGNTALEEVAVALKVLYGYDLDFNFQKLKEVSTKVQEYSNFRLAKNKPIVGDNLFVRESGMGIDLVFEQPMAMFSLHPSFTGNKAGIVLGKKSGRRSIEFKANELGLNLTEEEVKKVLGEVKNKSIVEKRTLTDEEFLAIVKGINNI